MIWESWHWKQPLLEMAERLRYLKSVQALSEEQLVKLFIRHLFIVHRVPPFRLAKLSKNCSADGFQFRGLGNIEKKVEHFYKVKTAGKGLLKSRSDKTGLSVRIERIWHIN